MEQHAAERIARGHHAERVIANDLPERAVNRAVQEGKPVPTEVLADDQELTPGHR